MIAITDLITALDTASDLHEGVVLSAEQVAIITGHTSLVDDLKAIQEGALTITDICTDLQVSRQTIWRLRAEGNFPPPCVDTGKVIRFDRMEYVRWKLGRHAA
jgi:predicted DNA-binding transcriptional regulator AlpA